MVDTVPQLAQVLEGVWPGCRVLKVTALEGQLSTRRYFRVAITVQGGPSSVIAMLLPDADPDGVALEQAHAFVDIQAFIAGHGLRAPHIYGKPTGTLVQRLMLLEDLGDETFDLRLQRTPRAGWERCYTVATDNLARFHEAGALAAPSTCIALRRHFDAALLRWELDHFREWGLEALHAPLPAAARRELDAHFDLLTASIVALPQGLVHRDYQSRNLMWAEDGALTIIDFQDAFFGPAPYDLVALLCDSYVAVDPPLQAAMLKRYAAQRRYSSSQHDALVRGFHLITVQRKLKDAGRFIFIDRVRKNPSFLGYYPASLEYAARALSALPELLDLQGCLRRLVPGFPL